MNRFHFIACLCIYIYEYVLTLQEVNTLVRGVWSLSVDTDERNIFLCCNTALLY